MDSFHFKKYLHILKMFLPKMGTGKAPPTRWVDILLGLLSSANRKAKFYVCIAKYVYSSKTYKNISTKLVNLGHLE